MSRQGRSTLAAVAAGASMRRYAAPWIPGVPVGIVTARATSSSAAARRFARRRPGVSLPPAVGRVGLGGGVYTSVAAPAEPLRAIARRARWERLAGSLKRDHHGTSASTRDGGAETLAGQRAGGTRAPASPGVPRSPAPFLLAPLDAPASSPTTWEPGRSPLAVVPPTNDRQQTSYDTTRSFCSHFTRRNSHVRPACQTSRGNDRPDASRRAEGDQS